MLMGDRVPMFKLRPYHGLLAAALFVSVVGGLLTLHFYLEDNWSTDSRRWILSLIVTIFLVMILLIVAFSRYRFSHLHHHRPGYKCG